jgi:hypothetical protein
MRLFAMASRAGIPLLIPARMCNDDTAFRRRILIQLNHTELRHRLGRRFIMASAAKSEVSFSKGRKNSLDPWASPSTSSCTKTPSTGSHPAAQAGWYAFG